EVLLARAAGNAETRGLADRLTLSAALGPVAPADLVLNVGAEHVFGDLGQALAKLWPLVGPGGRLLFGTQFWERSPTPALVEAIGELPDLSGLIDAAAAAGWRPLGLRVATAQDWDHFEFGFLADWEQFVMAPPTLADAERARQAADDHRAEYLERRGVLGFAFLTLGRPPDQPA
ncbi:MAG: SAM-dependent methyltransferase, partial [Actinomycetota bacterium]